MKKIDLHIHSTISDGELTPFEIIDEAVKNGVEVLSITDHDSIMAYTDELYQYAEKNNIILINGVEISARVEKSGIHILGYNYDIHNQDLIKKLEESRNSRHIYLNEVSKKLIELGYKINVEELDKIDAVTKSHISLDIIENPENEELLIKNFGKIPNKGAFIEATLNKGCPAFVKKPVVSPKEAIDLIHNAGGKAVLAHPIAYVHQNKLTDEDLDKIVEENNFDGVEADYIFVDAENNKFYELDKWNKFAKKHDLKVTLGSDFHKKIGIKPVIGLINENLGLSDNEINNILNFLIK